MASLLLAVACGDDNEDSGGGKGGSSGSAGKGGSSGSATGGSSGKGGSSTGGASGSSSGASGTAGTGANGGKGGTGGTGGSSGVSGDGGVGAEGGMGGVGAEGGMGGMGGEGGEMVMADTLDNPGFEDFGAGGKTNAIPGWQEANDLEASYLEWDGGRTGHKLAHWREWIMTTQEEYTANTFQRVAPIPNGTYTFSMWVNRKAVLTEQYLYARGHNAADPTAQVTMSTTPNASEAGYVQVTLSGIQVTSGEVTVGIYTHSWGNDWANMDDASLTKDP